MSSTDVVKILSQTPTLLTRSLENQIIPSFEFVKNLIGSEDSTLSVIKNNARPLLVDFESRMIPNVDILREVGVPDAKIAFLLMHKPRAFTSPEKFKQIVEAAKGMGLNPLRVFKKWGLSADEILVAFGKHPRFMVASVDKITRVMDFLVNKMGLASSLVSKRPVLLTLSFEKRIFPRCLVYQAPQEKGLIKESNISWRMMLESPEKCFIKKIVKWNKEEAPELLKLYKEKLALAR